MLADVFLQKQRAGVVNMELYPIENAVMEKGEWDEDLLEVNIIVKGHIIGRGTTYETAFKDRSTPPKYFADCLPYQGPFEKRWNKICRNINRLFGEYTWWEKGVFGKLMYVKM